MQQRGKGDTGKGSAGASRWKARGGMAKLGADVTEVLDYVPGRFQVIRHVRPKYACTACDAIIQAPAPAPAPAMPSRLTAWQGIRPLRGLIPRGLATPATLAHVLVSKFCDHLPLYRKCCFQHLR
jgi:transposase